MTHEARTATFEQYFLLATCMSYFDLEIPFGFRERVRALHSVNYFLVSSFVGVPCCDLIRT